MATQSGKKFFNQYFTETLEFPSNEVDAVVGFFERRGFDTQAAVSTSIVILEESKKNDVDVFKLLDTLKGMPDVKISQAIAEILNTDRPKTSSLGFRDNLQLNQFETRNIAP